MVIGPTGIYTIVSQKYTSKEDKVRIKQDKENVRLIGSTGSLEEYLANKNSLKIVSNFRDKQTHFQVKDEKIKFVTNNKIYYGTSKTIETVNGKNSKETSEEKVNSINSIDIESFTEGKWVQNGQDWSFSGYNDVNQPFIRAAYVYHRKQ